MVSVLAACVVDRGFEPRSDQTIDYKIGICCFSALSTQVMQHKGKGAKDCWLGFRIICPSGETCLSTEYCFSELALCKSN